jgi:hypothetical protein
MNSTNDEKLIGESVKGWGVDSNPANDPTYPMKKWNGDDRKRSDYLKPVRQSRTVEILQSNERPDITAVFGTSVPPSGLSGAIRRYAFRYSEGSWGHWLPLILADRVNVVEGLIDDLRHGYIPNVFKERGWNAEWKYNKAGMIRKIAIRAGIAAAVVGFILYRKKRK